MKLDEVESNLIACEKLPFLLISLLLIEGKL